MLKLVDESKMRNRVFTEPRAITPQVLVNYLKENSNFTRKKAGRHSFNQAIKIDLTSNGKNQPRVLFFRTHWEGHSLISLAYATKNVLFVKVAFRRINSFCLPPLSWLIPWHWHRAFNNQNSRRPMPCTYLLLASGPYPQNVNPSPCKPVCKQKPYTTKTLLEGWKEEVARDTCWGGRISNSGNKWLECVGAVLPRPSEISGVTWKEFHFRKRSGPPALLDEQLCSSRIPLYPAVTPGDSFPYGNLM